MKLLLANRALGCRELATYITTCLAIVMLSLLGAPSARAADGAERLRVADPYLEMHTGPGRGFPVFFVVARDEWVEVQLRYDRLVQGAHRRRQGRLGAPLATGEHVHRSRPAEVVRRPDAGRLPGAAGAIGRRVGRVQEGADAQGVGQLPAVGDAAPRRHARPGAGHVLGHRHLARQPAGRTVVRRALVAVLLGRLRQLQEPAQLDPGRCVADRRQARPTQRSACATT